MLKIQKARYRIESARNDSQHKAATEIVNRTDALGIETPDFRGMTQGKGKSSTGQISGRCHERHAVQAGLPIRGRGDQADATGLSFPQQSAVQQLGKAFAARTVAHQEERRAGTDIIACRDRCGFSLAREAAICAAPGRANPSEPSRLLGLDPRRVGEKYVVID